MFYWLAVALIAVSVWQSYADVSKIVSDEATALAALYRDVSGYPESVRPMILALDRLFRGDLGIGPGPYQLIYDQLMKL